MNRQVFIVNDDVASEFVPEGSIVIRCDGNDIFDKKSLQMFSEELHFADDMEFVEVVPSLRTNKTYRYYLLRNYKHR